MLETLLTPKNHQLIGQLITLSENEKGKVVILWEIKGERFKSLCR
jgi:hypothetical protein